MLLQKVTTTMTMFAKPQDCFCFLLMEFENTCELFTFLDEDAMSNKNETRSATAIKLCSFKLFLNLK